MPRLRFVLLLSTLVVIPAVGPAVAADEATPAKERTDQINKALDALIDANQDGAITDEEAVGGVGKLQKEANAREPNDRSKAILAALDANADGKVDNQEAAQAVAQQRRERDEIGKAVGVIFDKLDLDANQILDPNEFRNLVQQLGPLGQLVQPRLAAFFNRMDADRNGQITTVESQFAADYFAQQAGIRRQQQAAQRNARLVQLTQQTLAAVDTNRDGEISLREAKRNPKVAEAFADADSDKNRKLSAEEIYRYLEAAGAK